jgi:hypothetical protein
MATIATQTIPTLKYGDAILGIGISFFDQRTTSASKIPASGAA